MEINMDVVKEDNIKPVWLKRPRSVVKDEDSVNCKKMKREILSAKVKNPVMALNEIKPNLIYHITDSGPAHSKVFTASLNVNGKNFSGVGSNKKSAKARAAELVLWWLVQLKDPSVRTPGVETGMDFSQDPVDLDGRDFFYSEKLVEQIQKEQSKPFTPTPDLTQTNPLYCLNRLKPGLVYEIVKEEGFDHAKSFTAQVVVDGRTFQGVGSSKKSAKANAANAALKAAFQITVFDIHSQNNLEEPEKSFGDFIASLVETKYKELTKDLPQHSSRYKVLAGVVQTQGSSPKEAHVLCITTGTKCISGGYLSMEGETLNDSHAEVLARRCLVSYFYQQLDLLRRIPAASIFQSGDGRCRLKQGIQFHLFISSAPCGDARIFTLTEQSSISDEDPHPNRIGRGVLRTKIESGEGTVPVATTVQTWDGILQGERLLTMSCSDKVARWNVLGVQGSILTHLIEPIYFQTIVVGSLYHKAHLHRAVIGRISHIQALPAPFQLWRPNLVTTTTPPERLPAKSPKISLCWTSGWSEIEILDASTGRLQDSSISKLCKKYLFERFIELVLSNPAHKKMMEPYQNEGRVCYSAIKMAAQEFSEARDQLYHAFLSAKLGQWIKKPMEQDAFDLPLCGTITTNEKP